MDKKSNEKDSNNSLEYDICQPRDFDDLEPVFGAEIARILWVAHKTATENIVPVLSKECESELISIVKSNKPKRILEIGTAVGYSTALMALCGDAKIDTIEIDKERLEQAEKLWENLNVADKITAYLGDATEILDGVVRGKKYGVVFIDGPKSKYFAYLKQCMDKIESGGIIICDDVYYFGLVKGAELPPRKHRTIVKHLREFIEFISDQTLFETVILDSGNGIAIVRKK